MHDKATARFISDPILLLRVRASRRPAKAFRRDGTWSLHDGEWKTHLAQPISAGQFGG
jgi:hypothetical protein